MQALISHHKSTLNQLEKEHSRQLKGAQEANLSSQTEIEVYYSMHQTFFMCYN